MDQCRVVDKNDFNGKLGKALQYLVRKPESWQLSKVHRNVYDELKFGNNSKSWTIVEVTGSGLNRKSVVTL
jgi:hypothetical protein